jgi:hypothetical protein
MCVLDNTAQRRGQGKKQAHLEDSWHGAWRIADFGLRPPASPERLAMAGGDCGLRKARGQRAEVRSGPQFFLDILTVFV